jgi:hypothetical protein
MPEMIGYSYIFISIRIALEIPFKYYYFILFHTKHQSNLRDPIFHEPKIPLELQVGLRLVVAGSGNVLKESSEPAGVGGECIPFAPKFTDPVLHQGL